MLKEVLLSTYNHTLWKVLRKIINGGGLSFCFIDSLTTLWSTFRRNRNLCSNSIKTTVCSCFILTINIGCYTAH